MAKKKTDNDGRYGFVYIWYDRKHERFYIGCRWGKENDGYICSSPWMKQAYKHRPYDFKRRILSRIYTNRADLLKEEYRWLSLIKDHELKVRYYNLHNHHFSHWAENPEQRKAVGEKISKTNKGNMVAWNKGLKMAPLSEERKEQNRQWTLKHSPMRGKHHTEEILLKIRQGTKGKKKASRSPEHCERIRQNKLAWHAAKRELNIPNNTGT